MSKVASLTISAKLPPHMMPASPSPTDEQFPVNDVMTSSDSSEEESTHVRSRSRGSIQSSPEHKSSVEAREKVFDEEKGLIHTSRSGRMSSRQKSLEKELNTEDPSLVTSHDEARAASSSDDCFEDKFIPRETKDENAFHMITEAPKNGTGTIYEQRNIENPRRKSEPVGARVRSRTGKLMDNYEKDQSFDELSNDDDDDKKKIEKPCIPVSELKKTYINQVESGKTVERSKVEMELEEIRKTFRGQGMMKDDSDNDDNDDRNSKQEPEVLYKPLTSIKSRFLAAASGQKMSDSDSDGETTEEPEKEEVLASHTSVSDLKQKWQSNDSWRDDLKVKAADEINTAEVVSARNAFKEMERRKEEERMINRPVCHVKTAKELMDMRRQKTYGENQEEVDGRVEHLGKEELQSTEIDIEQIREARLAYERLEESKKSKKSLINKPSMKLIKQEEVMATMSEHRRKVSGEEESENIDREREESNGLDESAPLNGIATNEDNNKVSVEVENIERDREESNGLNESAPLNGIAENEDNGKVSVEVENIDRDREDSNGLDESAPLNGIDTNDHMSNEGENIDHENVDSNGLDENTPLTGVASNEQTDEVSNEEGEIAREREDSTGFEESTPLDIVANEDRKKVTNEEEDTDQEREHSNGSDESAPLDIIVNGNDDA